MASQLGYRLSEEEASQRLSQISRDESQVLFISEFQNVVIGWIHICGVTRLLSEPFAEIAGFIVDKEHRSQGFGTRLLEEAELWAKSRGYHLIRIRSNVLRDTTVPYYEKRGYSVAKTQNVFVKMID